MAHRDAVGLRMHIHDDFTLEIDPRWQVDEIGRGQVTHAPGQVALTLPPTPDTLYSDAQITDYDPATRDFNCVPPLRLTVRAKASLPADRLRGTAGFGFWNHPFAPNEGSFRLPQAVWFFFSSPPNDMRLALDVPGPGWKAATFDARRAAFLALLPFAPVGIPLMWIRPLYRLLWPVGQRALGVSEHLLDAALLSDWHTYALDWRAEGVTFRVDDRMVHQTPRAPRNALGFIAWIDNQVAVVTPQGRFRFGMVDVPTEQSLLLDQVTIE